MRKPPRLVERYALPPNSYGFNIQQIDFQAGENTVAAAISFNASSGGPSAPPSSVVAVTIYYDGTLYILNDAQILLGAANQLQWGPGGLAFNLILQENNEYGELIVANCLGGTPGNSPGAPAVPSQQGVLSIFLQPVGGVPDWSATGTWTPADVLVFPT
jgi:hypothetical protein